VGCAEIKEKELFAAAEGIGLRPEKKYAKSRMKGV
jgi:hypothetical protein